MLVSQEIRTLSPERLPPPRDAISISIFSSPRPYFHRQTADRTQIPDPTTTTTLLTPFPLLAMLRRLLLLDPRTSDLAPFSLAFYRETPPARVKELFPSLSEDYPCTDRF